MLHFAKNHPIIYYGAIVIALLLAFIFRVPIGVIYGSISVLLGLTMILIFSKLIINSLKSKLETNLTAYIVFGVLVLAGVFFAFLGFVSMFAYLQ